MANSVTLRDVANLAGVSIGTASQSLNNRPNVAPETRARVLNAARTLGYPIKHEAFTSNHTSIKVIGLLTKHDLGSPVEINPFYSHIQAGVEKECRRRKISLMYANIEVDPANRPVSWPAMIDEQYINGLVLAGTFIEETADLFQQRTDVPIVQVDSYAPNLPFDSVVIENIPAAMNAVEHLIQQGHTKIGLLGWKEQAPPSIHERKTGYCQTLQKHGIEQAYIQPSGLNRRECREALESLLNRHPDITAIFTCNDLCALGALIKARELGLQVPQDLSIVGFDDIDLAKEVTPALTTVHVYKSWLGTLSVRQVLERAQYPKQPKITISVATDFVVRGTVCPPRRM